MKDNNTLSKFILRGDFTPEKIQEVQDTLLLSDRQLIKKTFKYLNSELGIIENNSFFNTAVKNSVELISILCTDIEFTEEEVIINRKRVKKSREAILAYANKFSNHVLLEAANKLDELVLDKNINVDDLIKLIKKVIDKKEDINIIKKLLNTNKGAIIDGTELFDYAFNLAIDSINNDSADVYYYIALLKIFYSTKVDFRKYRKIIEEKCPENNVYSEEIYNIVSGIKRSLNTNEILDKYGIIKDLSCPTISYPGYFTTDDFAFTIDTNGTVLRDDAISFKKDGDKYFVGIHIADPTHIIKPNSIYDLEARNNFRCIFLPGERIKMLNKRVEIATSLDQNRYRNVISMYVVLNSSGDILNYYLAENVIKVSENLTYDQSDLMIDTYRDRIADKLRHLYDLSLALEAKNPKKNLYWQKKETDSIDKEVIEHRSDKIIGELSVLFNYLIAKIACEKGIQVTYRTQDSSYIKDLVRKLKIEMDPSLEKVVNSIYLPSKYSVAPRYHSGLNLPYYAQTTNPLRKYPDLNNLYLLHQFYFKDMEETFDFDQFVKLVEYFNQRNAEIALMKSEYVRAKKIKRN